MKPWQLVGLGWLLALLVGCNGLSGRNVPIGNPNPSATARLAGVVVSEQDPTLPIADAVVQLVADGTSFSAETDADGKFSLSLPKGKTYRVTVRPPSFLQSLLQSERTVTEASARNSPTRTRTFPLPGRVAVNKPSAVMTPMPPCTDQIGRKERGWLSTRA